jgi:hypothetical protein
MTLPLCKHGNLANKPCSGCEAETRAFRLAGERDRAVIARRKAGEKRHIAAIAGTTEWVHDKPNLNDGRLPESAFDWPIYRAAMAETFEDAPLSVQYRRARAASRRLHPESAGWEGD